MNKYNRKGNYYNAPLMINLELTEHCDLRCPQCYQRFNDCSELPYSVLCDLLEQASRLGTQTVQFSGGEPLLYPNIFDAVKTAKSLGFTIRISTSGKDLDDKAVLLLKENGVDFCHISLNGSSSEVHDLTRDGYRYAINAIEKLKSHDVKCIINWVAHHENTRDFSNMVLLARNLGVHMIHILMMKLNNENDLISACSYDDLIQIKKQFEQNRDLIHIENCFVFLRILTEGKAIPLIDKGCLGGRFYMSISAKGEFLPCPHLKWHSTVNQSIKEYWENDSTLSLLREIHKGDSCAKQCLDCMYKHSCQPCYAIEKNRLCEFEELKEACIVKNRL